MSGLKYGVTKTDIDAARRTVEEFKLLSKENPEEANRVAADFLERARVTENGRPRDQIVTQGSNW